MTLRQLLFPQARAALFDPPTDIRSIARHYTFSIEDLTMIRQRRRNANRLGFAVHLAYLRFPGRVLSPKETPSAYMLAFIADQLRIAAAPTRANPREEFADVLRELGGDLTGEHPIMDGRPHRMATLDDDRGEKSIFYVAHADGRPAGYAKNNRTGEEQRWKASAVTMTKEQFTAISPGKVAEREADRVALYERTADRLSAHIEAYPALSPDHDYLKAKRMSLEPGVFETPRGSMAIPAFDADGKLWSVQYVNSDGSKRFARESRKEGCFHMVGSTDPVGDLAKAAAIVVAEGYATAATLKSLHAEAGDPRGRVAFVAGFDAGNLPYVAQALRERYADAAMVIAADNDKAREGQEPGRNPGLIKGQQAASANGAVLMAPSFSQEELEAGFSDWNDLASHDEARAALVAKELGKALAKAFERTKQREPVLDAAGNWGMEELMEYFRKSGEKFGNPKVIELEKPAAFDLRWDAKPPLTLRWTWSDPYAVRIEPEEGSLLAVGISGAYDHHAHVKLANPANPWLYVSERYVDYPGKVEATTIDQCLTKEGEWMKEALEAGVKYLADLG